MTTYERYLAEALERQSFAEIWNATAAQRRVNVQLTPIIPRLLASTVTVGFSQYHLPSTDIVYRCFTAATILFFGSLPITRDVWMTSETIARKYGVHVMVYTRDGRLLPRGAVFIYRPEEYERVIIAVRYDAWKACINAEIGLDVVYMTLYKDSDLARTIDTTTYHIPQTNSAAMMATTNAAITAAVAETADGTTVIINGEEIDPTKIVLEAGSWVDVWIDRNVSAACVLELSDERHGYQSDRYAGPRTIVHPPKVLNPDARLVTHNTVQLWVRHPVTGKGRYLHRIDQHSVEQLTHCDISIDSRVLDAFRDYVGSPDIVVRYQASWHDTDNYLMVERSYMSDLYICDDATIIDHLTGRIWPDDLAFWKAKTLETSAYTAMMFSDTPVGQTNLTPFTTALGSRTVVEMLGGHATTVVVKAGSSKTSWINLPAGLQDRQLTALTYLNGLKVDHGRTAVSVTRTQMVVTLSDSIVLQPNDILTFCAVEDRTFTAHRTIATENGMVIPYNDPMVWREITIPPTKGWLTETTTAYVPIPVLGGSVAIVDETGAARIMFGASLHNQAIVATPPRFFKSEMFNIDAMIDAGSPLVIPLVTTTTDGHTIPILGGRVEVTVNGRTLIADHDYVDAPLIVNGGVAVREVVITTMEYFHQDGENQVEVWCMPDESLVQEIGYTIDHRVSNDPTTDPWYRKLTRVFANGWLCGKAKAAGTAIDPGMIIDDGSPYLVITTADHTITQTVGHQTDDVDAVRRSRINAYFKRQPPPHTGPVILERSQHRLTSPFFTAVVYDIITNGRILVDDPSDKRFIAQFDDMKYLYQRDVCVRNGHVFRGSLDYVDISPLYYATTLTTEQYRLLHRLATLVFVKDVITLGDTFNG